MADNSTWAREQTNRVRDFYNVYTRGFTAEAFERLFTRDTRDAYDMSRAFAVPMVCFAAVAAYGFAWPRLSRTDGRAAVKALGGH